MSKIIKRETKEMQEAFQYYYSLGRNRSYTKVAKKFNRSPSTIKLWANSFNWQERIKLMDAKIKAEQEKQFTEDMAKHRMELLKIFKDTLFIYKKNLESGKVQPKTTADLEKITKCILLLLGEATDKQEIHGKMDIELFKRWLKDG